MRALAEALLVTIAAGALGCSPAAPQPTTPPKPPRALTTSVFFVVDYEALLPVACFDAKHKKWGSAEGCLDLIGEFDSASVRLESGRSAKITGKRVPTVDGCKLPSLLLEFDGAAAEKPGSFAVWPDSAIDAPHRLSWEATKKGSADLSDKDRGALGTAAQKALASDAVKVMQTAAADVDGDGQSEIVVSATSGGFDPTAGNGKAGVFLLQHSEGAFRTLRTSASGVFRIEGTMDLDGDGVRELWVSERRFQNAAKTDTLLVLRALGDGAPSLVAEVETCWPKPKP